MKYDHFYSVTQQASKISLTDSKSGSHSNETFAMFTYLWTNKSMTWEEASDMCGVLGMYLPSMTNEDEFHIIQDMLAGRGYSLTESTTEYSILTPCRLESTLCVIYLSLQTRVSISELTCFKM